MSAYANVASIDGTLTTGPMPKNCFPRHNRRIPPITYSVYYNC
jgi:hypothetical protein